MICQICHKDSRLILNTCAECDPELHAAWDKAVESSVDYDTITPEMKKLFEIMDDRVINGYGSGEPVGILNATSKPQV